MRYFAPPTSDAGYDSIIAGHAHQRNREAVADLLVVGCLQWSGQ